MPDTDLTRLDAFSQATDDRVFLRATGLALAGRGLAVIGASGSGKSSLALQMMAMGAGLVSDDGFWLDTANRMNRPDTAPPMIEARGIGLLHANLIASAPLFCVVDLDRAEPERLPPLRTTNAPGGPVPLILGQGNPCLAAALCQYLKHGRAE